MKSSTQTKPDDAATLSWPVEPGWYWTLGCLTGMPQVTLMTAFVNFEDGQIVAYVGKGPIHRLTAPPALPLQFQRSHLPHFRPPQQFLDAVSALGGVF
jgi:hypothetical protein